MAAPPVAVKLSHAGTKRRLRLQPPLSLDALMSALALPAGDPGELAWFHRAADSHASLLRTDADLEAAAAAVAAAGGTLHIELRAVDAAPPPPPPAAGAVSMAKQPDGSYILSNGSVRIHWERTLKGFAAAYEARSTTGTAADDDESWVRVAESPHYQVTIRAFSRCPAVTSAETFAQRFTIPTPFPSPTEIPTRVLCGLPPTTAEPTVSPPASDGSVTVRWSFTLTSAEAAAAGEKFELTTTSTLSAGARYLATFSGFCVRECKCEMDICTRHLILNCLLHLHCSQSVFCVLLVVGQPRGRTDDLQATGRRQRRLRGLSRRPRSGHTSRPQSTTRPAVQYAQGPQPLRLGCQRWLVRSDCQLAAQRYVRS